MRAGEITTSIGEHIKTNITQTKNTTGAKTQQDRTNNPNQKNGMAKEDRGGEGRTYRIRIAIVQLSGDQWGAWIIILMNTSVW